MSSRGPGDLLFAFDVIGREDSLLLELLSAILATVADRGDGPPSLRTVVFVEAFLDINGRYDWVGVPVPLPSYLGRGESRRIDCDCAERVR